MLFLLPPFFGFLFPFCFFVRPSLTTCHPLYIPPFLAALSPFSTKFIHALHCFQSLLHLHVFFIMPRSFARTHLKISVTSGRGRPAVVQTTKRSIQELSSISAFVQARVRSPLTKCKNRDCARRAHPRTYLCYDSRHLHSAECQGIMVALLDDTLLDYRTTYSFLLVVDVALYLLLEKDYFQRQIAKYALLTLQESYFSTDFLLVIYDLFTNNHEDFARYLYVQYCSRASTIVTAVHNLYPSLFHGTGFFWGEL